MSKEHAVFENRGSSVVHTDSAAIFYKEMRTTSVHLSTLGGGNALDFQTPRAPIEQDLHIGHCSGTVAG